jgi:hypothetical protein
VAESETKSLKKLFCMLVLYLLLSFIRKYAIYSNELVQVIILTLSNPIFLPTTYSPALVCFGRERGWWITCNYPTVLKEKNIEKQKEYNLRYLLAKVHTT